MYPVIWQQDIEIERSYPKIESNSVLSPYLTKLSELEEKVVKEAMAEVGLNSEQTAKLYDFSMLKGKPQTVIDNLRKLEVNEQITKAIDNLEELIIYLEMFGVETDF